MSQENPLLNPLKKVPGISITLPTRAILYDKEVSQKVIDSGGEIHIHPLSTRDELLMRTPDLILNGQAFSHICKNSIEGINEPLELYQADHDAILVGLRIATYGDLFGIVIPNIEYDEKDEESKKVLEFDLNLRTVLQDGLSLGNIEDYQVKIESSGQMVTVQPLRVKMAISMVHKQLEINAKTRAKMGFISDDPAMTTLEQKEKEALLSVEDIFSKTTKEVTEIQDHFLINAIRDVDGVQNVEHLLEWYKDPKLTAKDFYPVRDVMEKFVGLGIKQTMEVTDPRTGKSWETSLPINPMDFFVSGPAGAKYPI